MEPQPYLTNLTPLRGVAAVIVIVFHADLFTRPGILLPHETSHLIEKGYLMVDFFFVLSGFIMSYVYAQHFEGGVRRASYKKFLVARFGRVYPLHVFTFLCMLFFYALLRVTGHYNPDVIQTLVNNVWAIPTNLLLLHAMHFHNFASWNGPSWSISVEWWMYMLFPFLAHFFVRKSGWTYAAYFLLAWIGMWWIVLYLNPVFPLPLPFPMPPQYNLDVTFDFGFLRCLFGFCWGMVCFQLYSRRWGHAWLSKSYTLAAIIVALLAGMHVAALDTFTVIAFPLIILAAAYNEGTATRFFNLRFLQRLGDWSYSIYLVHLPVLAFFNTALAVVFSTQLVLTTTGGAWLFCLAWIVATIFISALTYRHVEQPGRRWIQALGKSRHAYAGVEQVISTKV